MTNKEILKEQLDHLKAGRGKHYRNMKIQPAEFITKTSCFLRKATL